MAIQTIVISFFLQPTGFLKHHSNYQDIEWIHNSSRLYSAVSCKLLGNKFNKTLGQAVVMKMFFKS